MTSLHFKIFIDSSLITVLSPGIIITIIVIIIIVVVVDISVSSSLRNPNFEVLLKALSPSNILYFIMYAKW